MIAFSGGKIITVTNGVIEDGIVLIDGGKILAVGKNIEIPAGTQIINASGKWITPGFIDAHSHISALGEPSVMCEIPDLNEISSPIVPHVRMFDSFNCNDIAIPQVRNAGFTTCYTTTGGVPVINGLGMAIKLKPAKTVFDMYIPGCEQMKMALGENPKRIFGGMQKMPMTRLGAVALIRETLFNARQYSDELLANGSNKNFHRDFQLEAMAPLVRGQMKARIHCHRASDIVTAVNIAEEFNLDFALEHVTEGYKVAEFLASKNVTCVVGPLIMPPVKMEIWDMKLENPIILEKAGVNFCLTEDGASAIKYLPMHIGLCIAKGLSEEMAFKSITINPARLLGLDHRIGSLEPGKDADIAIFNGHPFCNFTQCQLTMIEGQIYHNALHEL
ncbi:MAG: amidohydrolase family protein [Anaerolineae bacterium]|nr:amidohydrolase family protein [Anaerolineae bacterium]